MLLIYSVKNANNIDIINEDIRTGLITKLLSYNENEYKKIYINNLSYIRKISNKLNVNFFDLIEKVPFYLNELINISEYYPDNEEIIKSINLLNNINNKLKNNDLFNNFNIDLFSSLEDIYLLYETLYRQNMINNIVNYNSISNTNIVNINNKEIIYKEIDDVNILNGMMVHLFNNSYYYEYINNNYNFLGYYYSFYKYLELFYENMTDEYIKEIYNSFIELERNNKIEEFIDKYIPSYYKNTFIKNNNDYNNIIKDNSIINQIYIYDKKFKDRLKKLGITVLKELPDNHLSAQIIRITNVKDFKDIIKKNSTGILFDEKGINPESIILSSVCNLESNNNEISVFFTPGMETSSSLYSIKTNIKEGLSGRINSEIVLNRENVKPTAFIYFGSKDKNFMNVLNNSKNANLPFIFIDYDKIITQLSELNIDSIRVRKK